MANDEAAKMAFLGELDFSVYLWHSMLFTTFVGWRGRRIGASVAA